MRLPKALCAVVGEVLSATGSHATLNALFMSAGAPGDASGLPHHSKWKDWLFRAGQDENTDSLAVLGNVLEEFMDLRPYDAEQAKVWEQQRARVLRVLEECGLRYYRFGRVLPQGLVLDESPDLAAPSVRVPVRPAAVEELLLVIIKGLRRAMHPLTHRRKGAVCLSFVSEYDVQDLLHALLRPWVGDIRPEEHTPSYAGTSTRMDFLLPAHNLVIETKFTRDRAHAKRIGDELIADIEHYRRHPGCNSLWCVIFDPDHLLSNAEGLKSDLDGAHTSKHGEVQVRVLIQ